VDGEARWGERLRKADVRRLYESWMAGLPCGELLDDLGTALYVRCSDILYLRDAREGRWRCLPCEGGAGGGPGPPMAPAGPPESDRPPGTSVGQGARYACPRCGWTSTREAFDALSRGRFLHSGGAAEAFERFVEAWRAAAGDPDAKMRAVDLLLHSFHRSLRAIHDLPVRSVGVNLIEGRLSGTLAFLEDLSAGRRDGAAERWRGDLARNRNRNREAEIRPIRENPVLWAEQLGRKAVPPPPGAARGRPGARPARSRKGGP